MSDLRTLLTAVWLDIVGESGVGECCDNSDPPSICNEDNDVCVSLPNQYHSFVCIKEDKPQACIAFARTLNDGALANAPFRITYRAPLKTSFSVHS